MLSQQRGTHVDTDFVSFLSKHWALIHLIFNLIHRIEISTGHNLLYWPIPS